MVIRGELCRRKGRGADLVVAGLPVVEARADVQPSRVRALISKL